MLVPSLKEERPRDSGSIDMSKIEQCVEEGKQLVSKQKSISAGVYRHIIKHCWILVLWEKGAMCAHLALADQISPGGGGAPTARRGRGAYTQEGEGHLHPGGGGAPTPRRGRGTYSQEGEGHLQPGGGGAPTARRGRGTYSQEGEGHLQPGGGGAPTAFPMELWFLENG